MSREYINISGWITNEFKGIDFGDKRLNSRLIKLSDSFAKSPGKSINQACEEWSQSKAAYRFFQNDAISETKILDSHVAKTIERAEGCDTILAIQDTSYISYKKHKKTQGLRDYWKKTQKCRFIFFKSFFIRFYVAFPLVKQSFFLNP